MKVIFVRHGKDDDRYRGGWSTLDLIPEGIEQARKLAKHLKEENCQYRIGHIISSDLPRTLNTASIISKELEIEIQEEFQIRETNNGDLAGILNEAALEKYPGLFFSSLKMDESYPNGESPNDFFKRIKAWFIEFCEQYRGFEDNVLIVTHGGVINIIYHLVKGIEWSNQGPNFKVDNCGIHVLNLDSMEFEIENKTDFLKN